MSEQETLPSLDYQITDYVSIFSRMVLSYAPVVGPILAEAAGSVIPNQRIDRLILYAQILDDRLSKVEKDVLKSQLSNDFFIDLFEESIIQATHALTEERRQYLTSIIVNSISLSDVEYLETRRILRILGEINDVEVIWLRYYLDPVLSGDEEFRSKHREILQPVNAYLGADEKTIEKATMQTSYQEHLAQLGLFEPRYRVDYKTQMLKLDSFGTIQVDGYNITSLGRLLLKKIGLSINT
jgi:hypothetical protein